MSTKLQELQGNFKKRKNFTIEERVNIVKRLNSQERVSDLAEEYNVNKSTISKIKKSKNELIKKVEVLKEVDGNLMKKKFTGTEDSPLERMLYKWFLQRRCAGTPVTGPILQAAALKFSKALYGDTNFKGSNGYLDKFKRRHGIRCVSIEGEKLSANPKAGEDFKEQLNTFLTINDIPLDQVYNCDETALYWKVLPNKTLVSKSEKKADGRKKAKNRITTMLCTNVTGSHKLPLFTIGVSEKPRCFEQMKEVPIFYRSQTSAWMTLELMMDWFTLVFLPEIKKVHDLENNKNKQILLIMDNAAVYGKESMYHEISSNCVIFFLPPNVTSLIQPLDQGIIETFKKYYKKLFVDRLVIAENSAAVNEIIRNFNLFHCFSLCDVAWNQVSSDTIRKCWKNLIPLQNNSSTINMPSIDLGVFYSTISKIPGFNELSSQNVREWLEAETEETGWRVYTEEEIIQQELGNNIENVDASCNSDNTNFEEESMIEENVVQVSADDAYKAINTVIQFFQTNESENSHIYLPILGHCCLDIAHQLPLLNL